MRSFPDSGQAAKLVADLPAVRASFFEIGVPTVLLGGRYRIDPGLTVIAKPHAAPIIRFGTSGLSQAIGVDISGGNVLGVLDIPDSPVILVNTAIGLFTETVRRLFGRFPFYAKGAGWPEIDSACAELREIIGSIDAEAAVPGCYWSGFVDDVQMGDFATEDVIAWHRRNSV